MRREFTLSYLTTAPLEAGDVLLLAEKVGYCAIGVRLAPLLPGGHFSPLSENPVLLRQTLARMKDTGVKVFDVDGVRLDQAFRRGSFDRQLGVAAELGAKVVTVIGDDPDEERTVDSFAELCDAAAVYDLAVTLEFMPYSVTSNFNSALHIVRHAQRPNARILLDLLHANRSHMSCEDIAATPPGCLSHAQLCDAPAEIPTIREELIHTARYARLLPGTGGINVRGMTEALPDNLPLSIEIPNTEQVALLGTEEWARRCLLATQQALET